MQSYYRNSESSQAIRQIRCISARDSEPKPAVQSSKCTHRLNTVALHADYHPRSPSEVSFVVMVVASNTLISCHDSSKVASKDELKIYSFQFP